MYLIKFAKAAEKDKQLIKRAGLERKTKELLNTITEDPFKNPPPYEQLLGNLQGNYSRRISLQHRLVYTVLDNSDEILDAQGIPYEGIVLVKRMWSHYDGVR